MSCSSLPKIISPSDFQSLYNHRHSYSLVFPPNSRWTKQSFKDECDINTIMSRYQSTGEMPDLALVAPQYLDATGMDFQAMQNKLVEAQNLFDALPSAVRNRFANDPADFLAFVSDVSNIDEMKKMGLLNETYSPPAPPSPKGKREPAASDSAAGQSENA